jgi:hypothetical protein
MKIPPVVIKALIAVFLVIAVAVHIIGFFAPVSEEGYLSHTIHLLSYSLCLFTFLKPVKFRLWLYGLGAIYPVAYHANCFFTQLIQLHKFNAICFEVIVILPLAALLIWQWEKEPKS